MSRATQSADNRVGSGAGNELPAALARRTLFEPIAGLLAASGHDALTDLGHLNIRLEGTRSSLHVGEGRPLRFVLPDSLPLVYEERIYQTGEVVTRPGNWHDYFNALVWLTFPRTKAALNALHVREMRQAAGGTARGPLRDAATQFDESGIVVTSSDAGLLDLLARRCWKELFWTRRADVVRDMRFLVFGHGLYDALRAPFYRICGRAALIDVEPELVDRDVRELCDHVDGILAARFAGGVRYPRPKALLALPLLGIPGVTSQNELPEYYENTEQFRPPPDWA